MAALVWRSPFAHIVDEPQIAWEGKASECLAAALEWFKSSTIERNMHIADGSIPDVPEALLKRAHEIVRDRDILDFKFTVVYNADGSYSIWQGDGPDRYDLID